MDDVQARAARALAGRVGAIVDACVVKGPLRGCNLVVSSDPGDLQAIANGQRLEIDHP